MSKTSFMTTTSIRKEVIDVREKLFKNINNDILAFLMTILPGYYSVATVILLIGYYGQVALKWIGPMIVYILAIVYFIAFIKDKYINPISKKGFIALEAVVISLKAVALVFIVMNLPLYMSAFRHHSFSAVFPIDIFLLFVGYIWIDIVLISGNKKREVKLKIKHSKKFNFLFVLSCIFCVMLFYTTFSLVLGVQSLATLATPYAPGFIMIALLLIAPIFSCVSAYMRYKNNRGILMQKISLSASVILVAALLIYQMIDPNFMVNSAKMFLPFDFISSFAIGPFWLTLHNLFPAIFFFAQNKKDSKAEG